MNRKIADRIGALIGSLTVALLLAAVLFAGLIGIAVALYFWAFGGAQCQFPGCAGN